MTPAHAGARLRAPRSAPSFPQPPPTRRTWAEWITAPACAAAVMLASAAPTQGRESSPSVNVVGHCLRGAPTHPTPTLPCGRPAVATAPTLSMGAC